MQDRFHMYENLTLDFYKKKCNVSLDFWPAVPLAVEIHLLVLEGVYRNVSNPRKKN